MERLEVINQRLLDVYGRGVNELPAYRIVWSTAQFEKRTGVFTKTTEAGIYLGEEKATREVFKYPMWPDKWILEFVMFNIANEELHSSYSYEPIWIFKDGNESYLDYDWEVIEKIIYFHIHKQAPKTKQMIDHEFEEKKLKEEAIILDELQHDGSFPNRMYDTPVVTVPKEFGNNDYKG